MEIEDDIKDMTYEDKLKIRSRILPVKEFEACKEIGKRVNSYSGNYQENWEKDLKEVFPDCSKVVQLSVKKNSEKPPFIAFAAKCKSYLPYLYLIVFNDNEVPEGYSKVVFTSEYFFDLCDDGPFLKPKV